MPCSAGFSTTRESLIQDWSLLKPRWRYGATNRGEQGVRDAARIKLAYRDVSPLRSADEAGRAKAILFTEEKLVWQRLWRSCSVSPHTAKGLSPAEVIEGSGWLMAAIGAFRRSSNVLGPRFSPDRTLPRVAKFSVNEPTRISLTSLGGQFHVREHAPLYFGPINYLPIIL